MWKQHVIWKLFTQYTLAYTRNIHFWTSHDENLVITGTIMPRNIYIYMYKRSNEKWDYWRIIQKSDSEDEVNALSRDEEAVGWKVLVIIDVIALPPSLNGVGLLATQLSSVTSLKSVWLLLLDWVLFTGFFATGL